MTKEIEDVVTRCENLLQGLFAGSVWVDCVNFPNSVVFLFL